MSNYKVIQEEACYANRQLPTLRLVILNFGNVSVGDHKEGVFAIKPSGVPYEELEPEKMVIVDFEGNTVYGNLKPSSDTKTHALLYKNWPNIGSIVHTHSTYATSWAQAQRDIPIYGTTHADYYTSSIPCVPPMEDHMISGDYEFQTGYQIINYLKDKNISYEELEMILIGNHAPFTWGKNANRAIQNSVLLEYIAHMAILTEQINAQVTTLKPALIKKHFERKHGRDSYYGQ